MNRNRIIVALLTLVALIGLANAQTPRRGTPARTPTPKPTPTANPAVQPAAQPSPSPADTGSPTLAIVNDVVIAASDIEEQVRLMIESDQDLYLREFYEDRDKAIKGARERALVARIGSLMTAAEAKKRGLSTEELIDREVTSKVGTPSEADIRATYDANRAQIGNADLEAVRPQLVNYLRGQRSEELFAALVNRLKMTNTVMKNADVNAPNLAPGTVVAAVNGTPIRIDSINERMKAYVFKMEARIYAMRKQVLDQRIDNLLVVAEANKRKIAPEEIIRAEVTDKVKPPTEAEITKFLDDNKARTSELNVSRAEIAGYLQQQQQETLEKALADKLRIGAKLQVLLKEPEPPVMNVSVANGPSRGDANSTVTIIEFTDFQCSACGGMYPIVEDTLKSYGSRVHFVIRNFPLTSLHANAFRAAQAAAAANAQGKFWEYIDILFKNQNSLDVDSLKKYATQVGLDRKRFDADLDGAKYDADIRHDIEEGEGYGVEATPTIYINGVMLTEFSVDGLHKAIEKAFAQAPKRP
jgi:protein-disulfide isomerase